jgi:uncharacterized protein YcbK (DUF882 family)
MRLSDHVMLSQLDQPEGNGWPRVPYPREWVDERARPLAAILEFLVSRFAYSALTVISGYRSPTFNEALRAAGHPVAKHSQHCEGRAVDVRLAGVLPTETFTAALHAHHRGRIRLGGAGLYTGWVHLDIRPGRLVQWMG